MTNLLQPDEALAVIIGDAPLTRTEVVKKLWGYIRENGLQDAKNPHYINADDNLRKVFGGKEQVTLLELTRLVNKHLFVGAEGEAVTDEELEREFEEQVLAGSYETLGCSPEISDAELKQKYRELSREYHPDRLVGEEIPASIVKLAKERNTSSRTSPPCFWRCAVASGRVSNRSTLPSFTTTQRRITHRGRSTSSGIFCPHSFRR